MRGIEWGVDGGLGGGLRWESKDWGVFPSFAITQYLQYESYSSNLNICLSQKSNQAKV